MGWFLDFENLLPGSRILFRHGGARTTSANGSRFMDVVRVSFAFVRRVLPAVHSVYAPSCEIQLGQRGTPGARRIFCDRSGPFSALGKLAHQETPQTELGACTLGVQLRFFY